jgi:hypothetical protein
MGLGSDLFLIEAAAPNTAGGGFGEISKVGGVGPGLSTTTFAMSFDGTSQQLQFLVNGLARWAVWALCAAVVQNPDPIGCTGAE